MSTDWQKYFTPEQTIARARQPTANIIIEFLTGAVRKIPNQLVINTPEVDNRAHTDVFGEKTVEVRERFMQIYRTTALETR